MRVFLVSVLVAVVVAGGSLFGLGSLQQESGKAYSSSGVRLDRGWTWRRMLPASMNKSGVGQKMNQSAGLNPDAMGGKNDEAMSAGETCEQTSALRWLFIDFSDNTVDESGCNT